ncbi:MAG TPA: cobalamin-dependent protein [Vicinamibacteria bacterium]|nr:cobalamin-dependent protein [Vicinamibacteria bacterium]
MVAKPRSEDEGAWLSIGALSRATGVAVETLRTWESRYGFPLPERKPSGHRVYPVSSVPRLRRIAQALSLGHRAGQVVGVSDEALSRLLETSAPDLPSLPSAATAAFPPVEDVPGLLRLVKAFDGDRLTRLFLADWARMGPVEFLDSRIAPLVHAVGEGWEQNDLEIRHEHFVSERIGDLLRSLRMPFEERATGPVVAFATLPGEAHGLGLQMAALVLAAAGCRALYLGTEVPIPQVASLARDVAARAVAISVSSATKGPASATALRRLRDAIPRRVLVVAGGDGAPAPRPGLESLRTLRDLDAWGRRVAAGLPVHGPRA